MEAGNTKKPRITTLDDLFGIPSAPDAGGTQIQQIELRKLHEFEGHPFKVLEDQALLDMAKSIQEIGQLTPAIARPLEDRPGEYELVSGNRRHRACLLAGLTHMRVIVKEMTRDEAIIQMVDANLQREHILPSERAKAYKMKLDAIRRRAGRPAKDNSGQVGPNFDNRRTNLVLAAGSDDVGKTTEDVLLSQHIDKAGIVLFRHKVAAVLIDTFGKDIRDDAEVGQSPILCKHHLRCE